MKTNPLRGSVRRLAQRMAAVAAVLLVAFVCTGCGQTGPRNCRISGAVTLDGTPVQDGAIQFDIVKPGDVPGGAVIINGRYQTWVSPGPKTVRFAVSGSREGLAPQDGTPNICPPKYHKNPLEIDVRKDGVYDFPLTSK